MRSRLIDRMPDAFASAWGLQTLFRSLFSQARPSGRLPDSHPRLSEREREVLGEVSKGQSHEQISRKLGIAPRTVDRHIANVYAKLGVSRSSMAVARAAEIGLLDIDPIFVLRLVSGSVERSSQMVDTFCQGAGRLDSDPALADLKQLAGFGLLLMALSGAMARQLSGDSPENFASRGLVLELDRKGVAQRTFGPDRMGTAHSIVQAPEHAATAGYTPGNLFIAHNLVPQQGLNRAAISEYMPDGKYVRTFCGSRHLATRIVGPLSLAFAADGQLLATSGWLTDGILAFSEGGRTVSRFADGLFWQIAVAPQGPVYGVQHTEMAGAVRAFDAAGRDMGLLAGEDFRGRYYALAMQPTGRLFVMRDAHPRSIILELGTDGCLLRDFEVPGYRWGYLTCDAEGQLYVPCDADDAVKVISKDGSLLHSLPLGGRLAPHHTAISADGRIWVCGRAC